MFLHDMIVHASSMELLLAPRMSERPACVEHLIDRFYPCYEEHAQQGSTTAHDGTDVEGDSEAIRPIAVWRLQHTWVLPCRLRVIDVAGKKSREKECTKRVHQQHEVVHQAEVLQPEKLWDGWYHDSKLDPVAYSQECSRNIDQAMKTSCKQQEGYHHYNLCAHHPKRTREHPWPAKHQLLAILFQK